MVSRKRRDGSSVKAQVLTSSSQDQPAHPTEKQVVVGVEKFVRSFPVDSSEGLANGWASAHLGRSLAAGVVDRPPHAIANQPAPDWLI